MDDLRLKILKGTTTMKTHEPVVTFISIEGVEGSTRVNATAPNIARIYLRTADKNPGRMVILRRENGELISITTRDVDGGYKSPTVDVITT